MYPGEVVIEDCVEASEEDFVVDVREELTVDDRDDEDDSEEALVVDDDDDLDDIDVVIVLTAFDEEVLAVEPI